MIKSLLRFLVIVVILFSFLLHPKDKTHALTSPVYPYYFEQIKKGAVIQVLTIATTSAVLGSTKSNIPTPTIYRYPTPTIYVATNPVEKTYLKKIHNTIPSALPITPVKPSESTQRTALPIPYTNTLITQINEYRKTFNLTPVIENSDTCRFAQIRADEIVSTFNHDGFTNRIQTNNLPYTTWSNVVENIAMNTNADAVISIWKNSPKHAENMRANTQFVCVRNSGNYFAYEGLQP